MITVASEQGTIDLVASVTEDVRAGALSVPHGYEASNVSVLMSDTADIDLHTGMVLQSEIAVTVTPARCVITHRNFSDDL